MSLLARRVGVFQNNRQSADYETEVLADSPDRYWRLGESSGTTATDEMGNGNGTYQSSPTLGVTGAISGDANTAVDFDGTADYMSFSAYTWKQAAGTFECWFKSDAFSVNILIDESGSGGKYVSLNSTTKIRVYDATAPVTDWTVPTMSTGTWYHLVVTRGTSNACRVYLNGVESSTGAQTVDGDFALDQLARYYDGGSGSWYDGAMDEVALYGTALSASRVLAHYNAGT